MRALLCSLATVAACSTPALDDLPSPETCLWEYDAGRVNDVTLTMQVGAAGAGAFSPLTGGEVEVGTLYDGRWGFAVDLRIATADAITFPETVCAEVMGTVNFEGDIDTRGLRFRRQADGSMIARNTNYEGPVPSPAIPFQGVVLAGFAISPNTIFGFDTYSGAANTSVIVDLVNHVGFLSRNPGAGTPDAAGIPDARTGAEAIRNCTDLLPSGAPYCTQFDLDTTSGGEPPSDALLPYTATYCPNGGIPSGTEPCPEPLNALDQSAVCTVPTVEPWGTMTIRQYSYGPVADPVAAAADCAARGGTYAAL